VPQLTQRVWLRAFVVVVILGAVSMAGLSASNPVIKYLIRADISEITGLQGLDVTTVGITRSFFRNDGKKLLEINYEEPDYYNIFKGNANFQPLAGVGQKALIGYPKLPYMIIFVQNKYCVTMTTFSEEGSKLLIVKKDLIALAKIAAGRIKEEAAAQTP
jgi:hypothetical protein